MRKSEGNRLKARDVFLRPLMLTTSEILGTLSRPRLLLFLGLVVVTLTLADPGRLLPVMPTWKAVLIWLGAVGIQTTGFAGLALLWAKAQDRLGAPVIFLPLIGLVAYMITYAATVLHINLQTGRPFLVIIQPSVALIGYLIALVFETLYFAFVLPVLLREFRERHTDQMPDPQAEHNRHICIAGMKLPLDDIQTLRSREHFVLISTPQGQKTIRARLGDLVPQTTEADGVLAHRSYWVARRAISHLDQENGSDVIVTHDGERLKVAQTRQDEVRQWLDTHLPEISVPGDGPTAPGQGTIRR